MKKILVLAVLLSSCGFEIVDTGFRGVKVNMGEVENKSLPEGLYFYNPITSDIKEMNVRVQSQSLDVACYTKDVQQAQIKINLMFSLQKESAHLMFRDYGFSWEEAVVWPIVEGTVKTIVGQWDAVDLIANREKARSLIENALKEVFKDRNIEISKIELTNIDYDDAFEKAVERKVVAIQSAIEAQNKTKQIEEEAKQKIVSAKAEAESMRIRSQALSQNKSLVEYEAVMKWNGELPTYMMGNSVPFIKLGEIK